MRNIRKNETSSETIERKKQDKLRRKLARKCKTSMLTSCDLERGIDVFQHEFDIYQQSLDWYDCKVCKKRQICSALEKKPCKDCHLFTMANDMDPQAVPSELQNLSFVEQQLIARIHPVVSLFKVKNVQYKYTGQVINFPQHVQEICDVLPNRVEDLTGILTIRCENSDGHKDFIIRKKKVLNALVWLKQHNPFYNDITISGERLKKLPDHGSVYKLLRGYDIESEEYSLQDADIEDSTFYIPNDENEDEEGDSITYKDIPDLSYVSQKDQLNVNNNVLLWPSIGKIPVNEFSSPGYITMSFPHLFCYGTCDYSNRKNNNISLQKYIEHLMLYQDQRFAQDPRFRFFMLNSMMRWQALKLGNIFVKQSSFFNKMTVFQLKQYLKKNPGHVKDILFYSRRIRSTKAYWKSRCSELEDMVKQIGAPTIFFTLSSADYHWNQLYRLLGYPDGNQLTYEEKSKLLSDNPLVVTTFFKLRVQFFLRKTFTGHFDVEDFWYRTEFQSRGSSHIHGVAWLKNAPDISKITTLEEKEDALKYFTKLVSCQNPDISFRPSIIHPCTKMISDVENPKDDLAELVNRVQRHTCSGSYCLKKRNRVVKDCRFGFPKPLEAQSSVVDSDNGFDIQFARNDQFVNNFNPWVLQTWRSNIDFSPILSEEILYKYIAKYASKCEYNSADYSKVLHEMLGGGQFEDEHCKKVIRKMMIKTCAEHDYSAQEVIYLLMGFPLYNCSREFVILNLNNKNWKPVESSHSSNDKMSFMDRYASRPKEPYGMYSFAQFAKECYCRSNRIVVRKKHAIVRLFPRFNKLIANYEDLVNACIFHVPWRSLDDFYCNEEELKAMLKGFNLNLDDLEDKDIEIFDDEPDNSNEERNSSDEKHGLQYLSQRKPTEKPGKQKILNQNNFNYANGLEKFDYNIVQDLANQVKDLKPSDQNIHVNYDNLSEEQNNVFSFFKKMLNKFGNGSRNFTRRIMIQGKAGTGKSFLLQCMKQYVKSIYGPDSFAAVGPTGVSAKNINGSTIHSFFRLPTRQKHFKNIVGSELYALQEKAKDLKVLFIDEISMVGCKVLAMVDQRCREMKDCNEPFGNLLVFLIGDIYQIKSVGDKALYDNTNIESCSTLTQLGKAAIDSFEKCFFLETPQRYDNYSYSNFLERLSLGICTSEDCQKINARSTMKIKSSEEYSNSLMICSLNEDVKQYNNERLMELGKPIVQINAINNCKVAFKSSDTLANGLANVLYLAEGARIMLRQNLNVKYGLVNGTLGYVTDILYDNSVKAPSLPKFIIVKFDNVHGFNYFDGGIPLQPIQTSWQTSASKCTRVQFSISLSWACTVHKAQGLTVDKCCIDLGSIEFEIGLTYVALSRVRNIESLVLLNSISLQQLNSVKSSNMYNLRENFVAWMRSLC